jgi:CCR4-NOT transcription complex subunit 4
MEQKASKTIESRKHLQNIRVVQKNLVYVTGLPAYLADEEVVL